MMHQLRMIKLVQVFYPECLFRLGNAGIRQLHGLAFDVDLIIFVQFQ